MQQFILKISTQKLSEVIKVENKINPNQLLAPEQILFDC